MTDEPIGGVLGVSELVVRLRELLWSELGSVWVEGEIRAPHFSRAGHVYFDLVDEGALLRCAMFARAAARIEFKLEDGMQVRVRARPDVYAERGALQLVCEHVALAGEGALRLAFERMKQRLETEGLFDDAHKQPLPFFPLRVGLVTSIQGAALHDVVRALRTRDASLELVVFDARVQGEGAWREIVRGLHVLDADPGVQVIVLSRGGGSMEDLWTFNREEVVRAIFELRTPVVSAIGHEVDVVLADLVADARASTPTGAAALVSPDVSALAARVSAAWRRLLTSQTRRVDALRGQVRALERGLVHPAERLRTGARRLEAVRRALVRAARAVHARDAGRLGSAGSRAAPAVRRLFDRADGKLRALGGRLDALSPLAVLARGYAIAQRAGDGAILTTSAQVKPGEDVRVRLSQGSLIANVNETVDEE